MARIGRQFGCPLIFVAMIAALLSGCAPSPEMNVIAYLISDRLGTLQPADLSGPTGSLTGQVLDGEQPIVGADVIVAERTGRPHTARTDVNGAYRIDGVPVGQYVPAAIAPGYDEAALSDRWGVPKLIDVTKDGLTQVPSIVLIPHVSPSVEVNNLQHRAAYTATAAFPMGAIAKVDAFQFEREDAVIDTLRLYRPLDWPSDEPLPLTLFVYPSAVDNWESVSVAYASEGLGVVAISPIGEWGLDIDEHARDAFSALRMARSGELGQQFDGDPAVALGGSFSSAILNRLLRLSDNEIGAWVTVGGIGDAFDGAHDFYTDAIEFPEQYQLVVPAMGNPQLYPLTLLRFSPVYAAAQLPPTLIIHTASDRVIPIGQAEELAAVAAALGVPVETYFYEDVSHYLEIDDNMTDEAKAMFYHIRNYIQRH